MHGKSLCSLCTEGSWADAAHCSLRPGTVSYRCSPCCGKGCTQLRWVQEGWGAGSSAAIRLHGLVALSSRGCKLAACVQISAAQAGFVLCPHLQLFLAKRSRCPLPTPAAQPLAIRMGSGAWSPQHSPPPSSPTLHPTASPPQPHAAHPGAGLFLASPNQKKRGEKPSPPWAPLGNSPPFWHRVPQTG